MISAAKHSPTSERHRMQKKIPIVLLVLAFLLSACQGATQTQPVSTPLGVTPAATAAYRPTSAATLAVAGTPGEASTVSTPAGTAAPAKCTVVSRAAKPTEASLFAPVSGSDWTQGPPDAPVTIIEYSDFM